MARVKTTKEAAPVSRTGEFVLGLLGGIFGFFGGIAGLLIGGVSDGLEDAGYGSTAAGQTSGETIVGLGWLAIVLSVVAIVAAAMVRSRPKLSGWLLLIAGVGGLISVSFFYLLPAALLIPAGLMALLRGRKTAA